MALTLSSRVPVRELLFYVALTALFWTLSFTVLFPLLFILRRKPCRRYEETLMGRNGILDLSKKTRLNLEPLRKNLFALLEHKFPNYMKTELKILDLSFDFECNFKFYSEEHRLVVTTSDSAKNPKYVSQNLADVVVCENLTDVLDHSCDVVISTLRLCSVEDVDSVLKEVKRILKPDGVFAFMEHVGFPEEQVAYAVQKMASPVWRMCFSRCNLHRHLTKSLRRARFSTISYTTYYPEDQIMYVRPTLLGYCTP